MRLANGFKHPRTLLADFNVAEQTLKYFLAQVQPKSIFRTSPVLVMHPKEQLEGGLTQVEVRAFAELALGAGARQVYVWQGPDLSTESLRERRFAQPGGQLLYPDRGN